MPSIRRRAAAFALLASSASPAFQQIPFDLPQVLSTSNATSFRRAADLNGDGALDLVALSGHAAVASYLVEVWHGDGGGGFQRVHSFALPSPHLGKYECAQLVDLSGDGRLDLVLCAEPPTGNVPVFVNVFAGLANGSFAATPIGIAIGGPVIALTVGDGDGDGVRDLAVLRRDPTNAAQRFARWILARPGASYVLGGELALPLGNEATLAALDLGADGDDDLACGSSSAAAFAIAESGAQGVLQSAGTWSLTTSFPLLQLGASDVAGDLDGDGDEDLLGFAVGTNRAATIPLLVGSAGTPVQGAALELSLTSGTRPIAAESIDWDGDGDRDLVWRNNSPQHPYGTITFFANDGAASFTLVAQLATRGDGPLVHLGDVDGDGRPDLIGARELYRGRARFPAGPTTSASLPFWNAVDLDDDGDQDRLGFDGSAMENDGSGAFAHREDRFPPSIVPAPAVRAFPVAVGDFDLDGRQDFVLQYQRPIPTFPGIVFDSHSLLFDDGRGSYREQHPATSGFALQVGSLQERTPVADLDGNGTGDFLAAIGVYFLQANGQFAPAVSLFAGATPIAAGDVDGDRDVDVLATQTFPYTQYLLFRNRGSGSFDPAVPLPFVPGSNPWLGALLDADDDGDLDFASATAAPEDDLLLYENVAGTFLAPLRFDTISGLVAIFRGDLDGDGRADLLASAETNAQQLVIVLRRSGPGLAFDPATIWSARGSARAASDLDGDGDIDLLGSLAHLSFLREGPNAGARLQVGLGVAGAPLLGTPGPVRITNGTLSHRLRQGLGGSVALWTIGLQSSALIDFPVQGVVTRNWPWLLAFAVPLTGAPNLPGDGRVDLELAVPALAGGLTFHHQAFVFDPTAPGQWRDSNALLLTVGF
ncbi:MAG: VCBS repeat-containing protein [Planctomycetes bacterium]|nr:VCBS repeat-containing protein [Planctomycetota bacterium]